MGIETGRAGIGCQKTVVIIGGLSESGFDIEMNSDGVINVASMVGSRVMRTGLVRKFQVGEEKFADVPMGVGRSRQAIERLKENGLLPTSLFRAISIHNRESFVILNPRMAR